MANDIAVSMYLNNKQYMQGINASKGALLIYNKQVGLSAKTQQRFQQSLTQSNNAMRVNQSFMSNAVFMVEDMSSVYGTSGLAGAIRAGSNNLTMMAAAFGPWAMAASVAVTAATQLYLAFNKDADSADKAKNSIDDYKDSLDEQAGRIDRLTRLRRQLARADESNETSGLKEQVEDDIASIDEQIAAFEKQKKAARARQQELQQSGKRFEKAAQENPMSSAATAANAAYDAAKEQEEKIAELEQRRQKLIEERAQKEKEAAMITKKHNEIVRQEVVRKNREEIAAVEEQIRKDNEAAQNAVANQQKVADNKKKQTGDKDKMRWSTPATDPSGARMGDRAFAESMARAKQKGFDGPALTKREQMAADAVRRKQEKIANAPRRQVREEMAKRDEASKATKENTKQQKVTVASLDTLAEEIRQAAQDRKSNPDTVVIGGLTL